MKQRKIFKKLVLSLAIFMVAFFLLSFMPQLDFDKLKSKHLNASAEEISLLNDDGSDKIAIIDSGYRYDSGFDELQIVDQYNVLDDSVNVNDDLGHGSAMLATLLGYDDGEIHINGINPDAEVVVIKVVDSTGRTDAEALAKGILYAVEQNVSIINISLGTSVNNANLEEAVKTAVESGIQIVAAVGDSNDDDALYPARYEGVTAIEAQANDGSRYIYSNECEKALRIPGTTVDTLGYNVVTEEWQSMTISGSSIATITFSSILSLDDYEVDYNYLAECKENDTPVVFGLTSGILTVTDSDDTDEYYEQLKEEQETISSLDHEYIVEYGDYVYIEDGKYQFDSEYCDNEDDIEYITENIATINELIDEDAAYLDENGNVILTCDEDVLTQFGFTKVKFHWYGVDATMDSGMLLCVSIISTILQVVNMETAKLITKGAEFSSDKSLKVAGQIKEYVSKYITMKTFTERGKYFADAFLTVYGSYDNFVINLVDTLSLCLTVVIGVFTTLSLYSGGVYSMVMILINYIIGTFIPSLVASIVAFTGVIIGLFTSGKMTIRWWYGWGTSLTGCY